MYHHYKKWQRPLITLIFGTFRLQDANGVTKPFVSEFSMCVIYVEMKGRHIR